jgi:hypothetical protein
MMNLPMRQRARLIRFAPVVLLLALCVLCAAGCKNNATPIHDLLANAAANDGKTVQVAGTVKSAAGASGDGVYQGADGTGIITVVTKEGGAPAKDSKVGVQGTFRSAFTIGTDAVAVIQESERRAL